ncbi:MAG: branched-chain amino acid ABC transporter permease [Roseovarius sp.]|nr:branched-chain amino acid ABC transporter permease [Roseovarius sp.]
MTDNIKPDDSTAMRRTSHGSRRGFLLVAALAALAALFGAFLPGLIGSVLLLSLMTQAVIGAITATGVGLLFRQNGVVSFGHAAFYGATAYIVGLSMRYGLLPMELAIPAALVLPPVLAFLLGLIIVRIPGVAFAMLTLAVGQAFYEFALKARDITVGDDGFAVAFPAHVFGISIRTFQHPSSMFVICWVLLIVVLLALHLFAASPLGRITVAIRENEERARFIGSRTILPRALVYALSAFVASIAGVMAVLYNGFVSPDMLHWSLSGSVLIMAIIGGPNYLWGPALGAVVFFFIKDFAGNLTEHWPGIIGIIVILTTLMLREGLAGAFVQLACAARKRWNRTGEIGQ